MSNVETAFDLIEYSEYSEPPSETNVTMEDGKLLNLFDQNDDESVLSLVSCISTASVYTPAVSEADVEFTDAELNDSEEFHSVREELYPTLDMSEYSFGSVETEVEVECEMLYPQAYITKLECPERSECDTPAPPMA